MTKIDEDFYANKYYYLVTQTARRINRKKYRNVTYNDLVSWGQFGLLIALRSYDSDRGKNLRNYIIMNIRWNIFVEMSNNKWISRYFIQKIKKGFIPKFKIDPISIYSIVNEKKEQIVDVIPSHYDNPMEIYEKKELTNSIIKLMKNLDMRKRVVIICRYYENLKFADIGKCLGCSSEYARQLHNSAISEMRSILND